MCNKLWYGIESISNSHSASSQLSGEFMLLHSFNAYTRKFGFERDSASPVTNLTARHCKKIYIQFSEFRASASCSKLLNVKSTLNTVKIFRANFVFQSKRRVAQKSWLVRNIFNTVKIVRKNSVSEGKRKLLKNPEHWKYFQYNTFSVYSLGVIRVIWASVVCNLD